MYFRPFFVPISTALGAQRRGFKYKCQKKRKKKNNNLCRCSFWLLTAMCALTRPL